MLELCLREVMVPSEHATINVYLAVGGGGPAWAKESPPSSSDPVLLWCSWQLAFHVEE